MATDKIITRDFILVFLAQFVLSCAYSLFVPTLPIYLSRLGSREEAIGILIGAMSVSSLVLRPFVGKALLKIPERDFMFGGALLFALSSAAYLFAPPFWPLFIVRITQGIGMACFYTASVTFVTKTSPETRRGQTLGYFFLAFTFAFAVAPSLGMFLINNFSFVLLFLLCTALSLGSSFLSIRFKRSRLEPAQNPAVSERPFLTLNTLPSIIVTLFANIIWGAITAFLPLYAVEQGVTNPGFFFAAYAVTLIVSRSLGGRMLDLCNRERMILLCLGTFVAAMLILAFSKTLPMFLLVAVIWGIGASFLFPSLLIYTLDRVGSTGGPVMGNFMAIGDLGVSLGSVIMGIVVRLTSYRVMFLSLAFTATLSLWYFYRVAKRQRGEKAGPSNGDIRVFRGSL
jgi:MFS family permease